LTNILRDVAEDAGCNRIYIPISVLAEHGIEPSCWLAGAPDGNWQRAIDEVGKRARELYHHGWSTIESLSPDGQRMFSLIWRSYHSLLEEVLKHKSRLWNQPKISLPTSRRWSLAASHFVSPLYHRLPQPTAG
jgi:phytoene synthase